MELHPATASLILVNRRKPGLGLQLGHTGSEVDIRCMNGTNEHSAE